MQEAEALRREDAASSQSLPCMPPKPVMGRGSSVLLGSTWVFYISPTSRHQVESESASCSLWPHGLYSPWNFPGQNTGVGSLSLLQGIFPTQGLNPDLSHCRRILYQLSYKGSPRILGWVAYPFSSRSSWPRNRTRASCIAGRFFTNWAIREALMINQYLQTISKEVIFRDMGDIQFLHFIFWAQIKILKEILSLTLKLMISTTL